MSLTTRSLILFLVVISCVTAAYAQAGKAELTGEVRDQNGALVTEARIVVTDVATGQEYSSAVNDSGNYTTIGQKPGT